MKYALVAFDFDGTLADTFPFFMAAFGTLADAHGFRRVRADEVDMLRGYEARAILRHVGLPLWKFPRVAMQFRAMMAARIGEISLFEGVAPVLHALADAGLRVAIVSSNAEENVRQVLGPALAARVAEFACGVSLLGKRHTLGRLRARYRLPGEAMLYVGDELRDIDAARAAGVRAGAVAWGYTRFDALLAHAPDEAFAHPAALLDALGV